ncbi:MAG: integral rane sensor signal transduction histidine kinase [Myxococcales bacterium]|nr:integral rane sensor signal transduction histidine kinase [Myxococcales bacterium]
MKLRGRFTLTLALAALVPISVAAVVTREVIASSYRSDYEDNRRIAEASVHREVARLSSQVSEASSSLADDHYPFVGVLLGELAKGTLRDGRVLKGLREQGGQVMRGLSMHVLTVTGPDDVVLITPHYRDATDDVNAQVRQRAIKTGGAPYFVNDQVRVGPTVETVLVAQSAHLARKDGYTVALWAGRKVTADLLDTVRRPGVDARVVDPTGRTILPPVGKDWASLTKDPPLRIGLPGPDGVDVALIEVAVSDRNLDQVLRKLTLTSAGLALGALGAVVLIGLLVARRTARDLDRLVEGSLAAARGDLDHRVPVRSKDEIGAVANAFNFMMEDLRASKERLVIAERIAAWQEIARRLAHEIKNPLTPIQMAMDTLRKTWKKQHPDFSEILEESTTTVLQEADRLKHIVSEFSDFARMPKPEFGRIDLNDVIRSAVGLYTGAAPVEMKLADTLPELDADKNQVNQVVLNLVENARDAISKREGGQIMVSTKLGEAGDRARLVVEDNGPGVPGELKDKVFAPYFTTKHAKGGTGLGLAIVHRIVSDHGGRIIVTDAKGGGARFTIELPLRNGAALLASRI